MTGHRVLSEKEVQRLLEALGRAEERIRRDSDSLAVLGVIESARRTLNQAPRLEDVE